MAVSDQLKTLVHQMPDADRRGMYTTDIDKEKIEKAIGLIHKGGRENVLGLIDMLGEPGSQEDVKPRYALHCLTNHVLVIRDESGRRQLCEVLASQLGGDRPQHVQLFLCQELGWAGRRESVAALGKLLTDERLSGPASLALVAIRDGAGEQFLKAWPRTTDAARRHIMDALAELAERQAASVFIKALQDEDREIRIAAAAGLAKLGEAAAADPLIAAADAAQGWERIQATKNCLVLAESLASAGNTNAATRIYQHLHKTRLDDSEVHIREAAQRGLRTVL